MNRHTIRVVSAASAGVALISFGFVGAGAEGAAAARLAGGVTSFSSSGMLSSVAATSASNAWAVGDLGNGKTLIVRWNGTAWKQVSSPSPASGSTLSGVAVTSAANAWAVGDINSAAKALIVRWNGTAWNQVSNSIPTGSLLSGVAATSASNAWAVGIFGPNTLIVRWNGTAWKQVPSPSPEGNASLNAVAATSASS